MGINVVATKLTTFALSGAIAGIAGWILVYSQGVANSESFAPSLSLTVVALTVLGGVGSLSGPLLGALLVVGVSGLFPSQAFLATLGTGVGVLQVRLHLPAGLVSLPLRLCNLLLPEFDDERARPGDERFGSSGPGALPEPVA